MGPIPPPHIMKEYFEIDPSFPDRIMKMTEQEALHRRSEDKKINRCRRAEIRSDGITRFVSPFLAFLALGSYMFLTYKIFEMGYSNAGSILSVSGLGIILIGFYRFTKNRQPK